MLEKKGIKSNWDEMAEAYEGFTSTPKAYSSSIEWPAIKSILPNLEGKEILDLGCGTGRFALLLDQFNPRKFTGIDLSDEMIKMAQKAAVNMKSESNFYLGDIENLSHFESNAIDFIFSSTVFHFIENIKPLMKDIHRILKKGSSAIFSVIHPVYSAQYPVMKEKGVFPEDEDWIVRYLNKSIRAYVQPWIELNPEIENSLTYSYHHTMGDYISSFIEAGLKLEALLEPLPPETWLKNNSKRYHGYINTPTYAIFKVKKI